MKNLKVALLQLMPENSLDAIQHKGLNYCRKAKEMGADIALFPEMWSNGYNIPEDTAELNASAISADSTFVSSFGHLAKDLDMAIGITILEKYDSLPRNTLRLFDRLGNSVLTYAKVHTCDFSDECELTAGDDFYVANLDAEQGPVKIGAMICYDREFPESARILMLKGAEIILTPNACPFVWCYNKIQKQERKNMSSSSRKQSLQCPNCGAGVDFDTVRCAYCHSVLTTTACPTCFTAVFKGVKYCPNCGASIADSKRESSKKLLCPRCELLLVDVAIGDTQLHECDHCGGIWLDTPSFNKICADREQQEQVLLYKEPIDPVKPQSEIRKKRFYIPCPECGELMNQKNYARISGVVIDVCKLHGIWFERHELRQIVNFIRTGGLSKARETEMASLQAEQSRLKAMQDSQSMVQRSLMSDPSERDFSDGRSLIDALYAVAKKFLR